MSDSTPRQTVQARVLNIKRKVDKRGNSYLGVTLSGGSGKKFWMAYYQDEVLHIGDTVTVVFKAIGAGRNGLSFLNGVKDVIRSTEQAPAPGPEPRNPDDFEAGTKNPQPPAKNPQPPDRDTTIDVNFRTPAPKARPHRVAEMEVAGDIDSLVDGDDPTRYGGVLLFKPGTSKDEVELILKILANVIEKADVRAYDGNGASPVYFIP